MFLLFSPSVLAASSVETRPLKVLCAWKLSQSDWGSVGRRVVADRRNLCVDIMRWALRPDDEYVGIYNNTQL